MAKLSVDEEVNWVEIMPRVLQQYHDAIGEAGFSPYNIIFGRHRHTTGIPYQPPSNCEDALDFSKRMEDLDQKVANTLNHKHGNMEDYQNRYRKPRAPLKLGAQVWIYKPTKVGGHRLDTRWWGPAKIAKQTGESTYEVEWEGFRSQAVHIDDLKEWEEPPREGESESWGDMEVLEYEATQGTPHAQEQPAKPEPLRILTHRVHPENGMELLVQYFGKSTQETQWENAQYIYSQYLPLWVEYAVLTGMAQQQK